MITLPSYMNFQCITFINHLIFIYKTNINYPRIQCRPSKTQLYFDKIAALALVQRLFVYTYRMGAHESNQNVMST